MSETTPAAGGTACPDLTRLTAVQMADGLAAGEITSVELTQAHLDRIERLNPALNLRDGRLKVVQTFSSWPAEQSYLRASVVRIHQLKFYLMLMPR